MCVCVRRMKNVGFSHLVKYVDVRCGPRRRRRVVVGVDAIYLC